MRISETIQASERVQKQGYLDKLVSGNTDSYSYKARSGTPKILAWLVVFLVTGCATLSERGEISKALLEEKFKPSLNSIGFPCSFGIQSSLMEYENSMVQGAWWIGTCIFDLERNNLYIGAPSPDDPKNRSKIFLQSIDLKEYGYFSVIERDRTLVGQVFSALSSPKGSQLALATRARLPRSSGASSFLQHPRQRVIINFEANHSERLLRQLSGFGILSTNPHVEVKLRSLGQYEPSPFEFTAPLRR